MNKFASRFSNKRWLTSIACGSSMALLATCASFLPSCVKKDHEMSQSPNRQRTMSSMSRVVSFNDWPTVENGILTFRDDDHLDAYISLLDSAIRFSEFDTDTADTDPHVILGAIEGDLGYTSLRNVTQAAWTAQSEIGWASLEDVPDVHFINDAVTRSLLNSNADIKVGGYIAHYISKDWYAVIPEGHNDLLNDLHALPASASFDEISNLDSAGGQVNLTVFPLNSARVANSNRLLRTTGYPFSMPKPSARSTSYCITPNQVTIDGLQLVVTGQAGLTLCQSVVEIEWGDGSPAHNDGEKSYHHYGISHNYLNPGVYTITYKARATKPSVGTPVGAWDHQDTIIVTVPTSSCYYGQQRTLALTQNTNNGMNRAIEGRVWVEQFMSPFGIEKHRIGARTQSYHYTSNKWRKSRIDRVVAQFSTTKRYQNCTYQSTDNGSSWPRNDDYAEACNQNRGYVGWNSVSSNHRIYVGNYMKSMDLTLTPCP